MQEKKERKEQKAKGEVNQSSKHETTDNYHLRVLLHANLSFEHFF